MPVPDPERPPGVEAAPEPGEPWEPAEDDAIIGKALRWSLGVLSGMVVIVSVIFLLARNRPGASSHLTALNAPREPSTEAVAKIPLVGFRDITEEAGIRFHHFSGASADKLLPETMGGGVAFFDFDGDGDADLLFINGANWAWSTNASSDPPPRNELYRNDGGKFVSVTEGSGLGGGFHGMGVACGDYDGDGRVDVLITGVGTCRLYHNQGGGKFLDVTDASGLRSAPDDWSTSATFFDYDRDGDLDLFISQYVRWTREIDMEVGYRLVGIGRAFGPPMNFPGSFPKLYRNDGNGHFTDVSEPAGIQVRNKATGQPMAKSLGIAPVDFNNDGWLDLIVANDTVQNFVFSNRWDGTFAEVGAESGLAFDTFGAARGAMGVDAGRFTEDESLGVSIGNFANEMLALYVSQPDALIFADEAIAQGVGAASRLSLTFGVFFFDYDLDGWLDLLTANGHVESEINRVQASQRYAQPAQLFWNSRGVRRSGGFIPVSAVQAGKDLFQARVGRGSAYADIDGDGDLDVVIAQVGGPPLLLRNNQHLGHHWVRFRLTGSRSNRDAIGAWVRLRAGGTTQWRQVMPTRGYLSQSELPLTFGLGNASRVEEGEVVWPSGIRQRLSATEMRIDSLNEIREVGY